MCGNLVRLRAKYCLAQGRTPPLFVRQLSLQNFKVHVEGHSSFDVFGDHFAKIRWVTKSHGLCKKTVAFPWQPKGNLKATSKHV